MSTRSLRTVLGAAALVVCAAAPAAAQAAVQTNKERVAGGAYDRAHDYDLVHQRIELRGFDWDSTAFKGRVATTLVARKAGLDSLVLDAGHLLRVRTVTDAAGRTLRSRAHGDTLVVFPRRPAADGDTLRFTIAYDGKVENGRGLTFIQPEGRPHRPRQIWSQGEDMDNHLWFPTYDFPNDKMTWELEATVPAAYTAVSNGRLVVDRKNRDGTRTMGWSEGSPNSTYLISLVVAPLVKVSDRWNETPVDYYVYPADSARAWPLFHVTPDMIDVYSRLTGIPYPWEKYAQTTVADFFGGMENVSATTLVDWLPDARAYQDRPWYQFILIPHELAHQWFGDFVTTEDWANLWLNEGFAEFMPGQYWAEKLGAHVEQDYYLDEYRQFMEIDARRRMPVAAPSSNNIYPKGALVLEMLKDHLGPQRFWASINAYLKAHGKGNATTEDLRKAIQQTTGEDLGWFFDQWLYQAGYPEFDVASSYDAAARRLTLRVKQTQTDSSKADGDGVRFTTPDVFRMPVTVRVGTASGDVTRRFQLDQREQTLTIDSVAEPTMVVFDDGNHILKRLGFSQPTAWLAEQLRRDANLWDRAWAVSQLGEKKGDAEAAKALADAATGADYYLTRVQAAEALGEFPATLAQAPLEAALRDTSAQVRGAAIGALGQLGGERAATLARTTLEQDSSYTVQAAALGALIRADSAGRHAAITRGLATPSYRDEVRNAALAGIAQTGDTTFIPAVEALLPEDYTPAFVLASLARRGNAHALQVLVAHLNDEHAFARNASFAALRQLGPQARPALQAALPGLKYDATKQQVQQLLAGEGRAGGE
ncbi:MAG TPA: M1 family aminopeptidase [Longimicrobiales bacterium]|nr:M1 family aminopeptidase [Longimicrobiales bacterium]